MKVKLVRVYKFDKLEYDGEHLILEASVGATGWEEIEEEQFFALRGSVESANHNNNNNNNNKDYKIIILTEHDLSAHVSINDFIQNQEKLAILRKDEEEKEKEAKRQKKELAIAKKQAKIFQKQIEDEENARKMYEELKNKFEK